MRIYGRRDLHWEDTGLYLLSEKISGIIPHDIHKNQYWVEFQDGEISKDFYNVQRAKEHAYRIALLYLNKTDQETGCRGSLMRLNGEVVPTQRVGCKIAVRASYEEQLDALEWAVEFMDRYERRKEKQRRVERVKMEDDGY